ncbi:MAG: hypothetical protein J5I94_29740 [Phaeodactylibacter sp.]|nr:hypothetical protein [Phaeodactylibacter sp.]
MNTSRFLCLWFAVASLVSCKSEYQQYVEEELASGITQDSLIFGMRMGQTKKEFFTACWELNKQKLISEGTGNTTARYITGRDSSGNTTPQSKDMLFYGIFDENDIMRGMDISYSYLNWAPWNRGRQSDSLLQHLAREYLRGYPGNGFIEIYIDGLEHPALVKVDGNRQILMYPKNDKDVVVKIEDLNYKLKHQWKKE